MKQHVDILEAEGELGFQITKALDNFRNKIINRVNTETGNVDVEKYDTDKEGSEKIFKFRQSLLSLKFAFPDYKTMYNMIAASLVVLMFRLFYDSYVENGHFIDVVEFMHFFRGAEKIFFGWWILAVLHYLIIIVVFIAMKTKIFIWLPIYLFHQFIAFRFAISIATQQDLGFGSVFIILCEGVRMLMKSHSYFRTKLLYLKDNTYKQWLPYKKNRSQEKPKQLTVTLLDVFGQVKRFSYFFMCPTLIYRDQYVLTPIRSLSKIIFHGVNFFACIYYAFILYVMCCKENIQSLEKKLDYHNFLITIIRLMLPSVFFLVLGFFGFLHSWLNLWSQITRFPDRAFYSDWWNSYQFGSYYRKWNIVVHDWLYYYIYLDLQRFSGLFRKYRSLAQLSTFIISAIIHELIVCFAIGFFYPILFILFTGPGIILIQNQKKLKSISINFIFWLQMYIGAALLFSLYLVQIFARQVVDDQIIEKQFQSLAFLIPRSLYLGKA